MLGNFAKGFFAAHPMLGMPLLALLIFVGVFALIVTRTFRMSAAKTQRLAEMPLEEPHV